jgi:predicted phosphodiesterase
VAWQTDGIEGADIARKQDHPRTIAVIADVHGNLPALAAVAEELARERVSAVWHLGDAVGYGAEPYACLQLLADLGALCIAGNHERALLDPALARGYNRGAAEALEWTGRQLSPEVKTALGGLPLSARPLPGVLLFHGLPGNPGAYLRTAAEAEAVFTHLAATDPRIRLGFFGHTHRRAVFSRLGAGPVATSVPWAPAGAAPGSAGGELLLAPGRSYLINPGSVGQPRDGDPRASFLVLDRDGGRARFCAVEYDVARAQSLILEAGFSPQLAARLGSGI